LSLAGGFDFIDKAVEDQRHRVRARIIGQHHVRPVQAQRLDVRDQQLVAGNAQATEAEILGDGVVFTVACALDQRFDRRRPIIDLVPQVDVFLI
nr:hypothetical protein [Tanacetum cinerariifolium]